MTPAKTIDILRQLHDWLRGGTQWAPTRGAEAVETAIEAIERMQRGLRLIADTDPIDAALDPQRAIRTARAALEESK